MDDDVGRQVGDAYCRFGTVDVLAARAGCAVNVYAQIGGVDFYLDVVVDFRRDEDGGKRGVAAVAAVKRRFAHEAVHADFGAEPAVGVFAGEFDGGGFDAGDVARRFFDEFGFESARLAPAQVHA